MNISECLLISSLPGKALRTYILKAKPGKIAIQICKPGILFISLHAYSLLKLAIMTLLSTFVSIQCH